MADEVVMRQQAREIGVAFEDDAVEIPGLALEPVGALEHAGERRELGVRLRQARLEADVVPARDGIEMQHDLEARRPLGLVEIVDGAKIEEETESQVG